MEPSPFLMKNLQAMAAGKSITAQWLGAQVKEPLAHLERIVTNRWNGLDWRMADGTPLFEKMPPHAFYGNWDGGKNAAAGATVLVGCNLGYGLNHVLTHTPNSHKVLVLEPDPEMLLACLGQTDYTPYFAINKLMFLPPDRNILEQAIRQADVQFLFGQIFLRVDGPSQQMSPEYAKWGRVCRECLENFSMEMATLRRKQDVMVGNEIKNFQRAVREGSVMGLENAAQGVGAVILGAGPSLADVAPKLARNPGYALYATALQTLPALRQWDLKPHFCMAIDYSPSMLRVFKRLDREWTKDIPLLYSTKMDPEVLAQYPGPTVPFWTVGGLATFVFSGREFVLDAGGNVSVAIYRFLKFCGVTRIALAGQDFAWREDVSHVAGHHASGKQHKNVMQLKDADGGTIYSTLSYVSALRDMESDIAKGGVEVVNIYGGGAPVRNAAPMDLDAARMHGCLASEPGGLERFLAGLSQAGRNRPRPVFEARAQQWASSIKAMHKRLDKLFKKPGRNSPEIGKTLEKVHVYLRQDPLYLPYLYNEIMDVAGMIYRDKAYTPRDYVDFKNITKRVLAKVREMDRCLAPDAEATVRAERNAA